MSLEELINQLPKYKYGIDNQRAWLTITTTLNGHWNIGYMDVYGLFMDEYVVGNKPTLLSAVMDMLELVKVR